MMKALIAALLSALVLAQGSVAFCHSAGKADSVRKMWQTSMGMELGSERAK